MNNLEKLRSIVSSKYPSHLLVFEVYQDLHPSHLQVFANNGEDFWFCYDVAKDDIYFSDLIDTCLEDLQLATFICTEYNKLITL